jgi:hypothetical protein
LLAGHWKEINFTVQNQPDFEEKEDHDVEQREGEFL